MKLYHAVKLFISRHLTPARILVLSFAVFILAGTLLLWLPWASSGASLRFVDALFTATSAVCVTGLSTIQIGADLSVFGQVVVLSLFQVGGLGIMTFSVLLFTLMGRGISFKGREIVQSTLMTAPGKDIGLVFRKVLLYSLVVEAVGVAVLFGRFTFDLPWGQAAYQAVFHAISAFNNCGFSLFSDSLTAYRSDVTVNLIVMLLIVTGGIGFIVQQEVTAKLRDHQKRLSLHTRIVLVTSAALILIGTICFYVMEADNTLKGATAGTAWLTSFFQSVTARTAGFNTVDIASLANSTLLVLMVLMFIGASPGSAGGGIKTTSFALLVLLIANRIRGNDRVNVANRTIPTETMDRTLSIIFVAAFCIVVGTSFLLLTSTASDSPRESRFYFIEYVFEAVSAFSTVGLSLGATPRLNDTQKYAIIALMFAGRVGPLTLAYAWYSTRRRGLTYAEESVMVG